ncbi:MAG: alpha/beta hydrolase [Hyphomicrobiaceae bacterium]|nr:alpha/beta hydrolase [Hyphomicrobiaceae bacterium]
MTDTNDLAGPDRSRLRPEIRAMLEELDQAPYVDVESITPEEQRENALVQLVELWGPPENVSEINDLRVPLNGAPIPVRIYRPGNSQGTILFFHGGGWVAGSIETHDGSCRMLANLARCDVVSVEYRKAPENPFPAGVNDCISALDWLVREGPGLGLDTSRLVISGESAGGNLAAVTAIHARDKGIELSGQVLVYPVIDTAMATQSYRDFETGFFLDAAGMRRFIRLYAEPGELGHPDIAPLRAPDLSDLAPALILTVDHDPLRDEGRAYAAALVNHGNEVSFAEIGGAVHGIWIMNAKTGATREIIGRAADWIRSRLSKDANGL